MSSEPDRLNIEEKDKEIYDKLLAKGSPLSRTNGFENKDIFFLAMCLGFDAERQVELKKRLDGGYILSKYLSEEDMTIMYSIAAEAEGLKVLSNRKRVFDIAEQYAAGGIHILNDKIFTGEFGDFTKHLENQLLKKFRELSEKKIPPEQPKTDEQIVSVRELIQRDESEGLEFKSSMSWDYKENKANKRAMEFPVAKTVSAFMNHDGGVLVIGVDDNKDILGLAKDFSTFEKPTRDTFEQNFTNMIENFLGRENTSYAKIRFETLNGLDIAIVELKKSLHPVFLKSEGKEDTFYIRSGNSSRPLNVRQATVYINDHWPKTRML